MKTMKFLSLAALALTFAACSSNDDELTAQQPAEQPGEITITATIDAKDGAMTRATMADDGTNITFAWQTTDEFAILYNDGTNDCKSTATVKSISGSAATIKFTIPATLGETTDCKIVYPATAANDDNTGVKTYAQLLATQDGTLSDKLDVRYGTGTITKSTGNLDVNSDWKQQYAIFKFTTQDLSATAKTATEFKVSDNSGDVITTVTPSSSAFYVALPAMAASSTYWFNATIGGNPYIAKATVSTATMAGNYYQSTVKMATIGDVIKSDGKFYATGTSGAVAMIAYVGDAKAGGTGAATCAHGLAIALDEVSTTQYYWHESAGHVSTWAASNTVTGISQSTTTGWRLPTVDDFKYMIQGCGGEAYSADLPAYPLMTAINCGTLDTKVYNLTGNHLKFCWTSNESAASCGYYYNFDTGKLCSQGDGGSTCYVRAVLAF